MAKDGGIDAFAVSWFTFRNKFDFNYDFLIKPTIENMACLAPRLDFKVYILYESHMNLCRWNINDWTPLVTVAEKAKATQDVEADFNYLLEILSPVEENPSIFVYLAEAVGLSPSDWLPVFTKIREKYPKARFYAETYNVGYLAAFDGLFSYGGCFNEKTIEAYSLMSWNVKSFHQGKKFYATVGPGFDSTNYWGPRELLILRNDGAYYQYTWQKALNSHPDGIFITSWNEWGETTIIEPSKEYGYKYIDITADNVIKFKQK